MAKEILANWNGDEMPLSEVKVSVLDRGFMFGDAVYEVVRIYGGHFFHVEDHLNRLAKSLNSLRISGIDMKVVSQRLESTLRNSKVEEGLAYLQITRGEAPRTHRFPKESRPNILIYVDQFADPYAQLRESGAPAVTHPDIRWARNDIKATSLVANCMAAEYAAEHGCPEVIFINSAGFVTEGSHTSIFGVRSGKLLVAPASPDVLPGITKKLVLELSAASKIEIAEAKIKESDIYELDEMFIAGTPEETISIVSVNNRAIGNGKCGPVVRKLQEKYKELIEGSKAKSGSIV